MRWPSRIAISSLLLLAACGTPLLPESGPIKGMAVSSDASSRLTGGTALFIVRTYVEQGGKRVEVGGASCRVQSREMRTDVVSPQRIRAPKFVQSADLPNRGRPENLRVDCRLGNKRGTGSFPATRHPAEYAAIQAGNEAAAPTTRVYGGVAAEAGTFIGNAITRQIFLSSAWTFLYSPGNVILK